MMYFAVLALIGFVVFSLRFAWWAKSISYEYPRVLMYHMISEHLPKNKSKFNRLRVKPSEFEKQLKWLKKNEFTSYTLSELVTFEKMPYKAFCLTFDDGYRDNFINALPLLQRYGFNATIFIVNKRFSADWASDKDLNKPSSELNGEEMLSDEEVKKLLESGLIEIGSHTLTHVNLPHQNNDEKFRQINDSKLEIEAKFGISCTSFAYPFGFYDETCVEYVKRAKFSCATTTKVDVLRSAYSKFEIPRIMISGRQGIYSFILKIKKGRSR